MNDTHNEYWDDAYYTDDDTTDNIHCKVIRMKIMITTNITEDDEYSQTTPWHSYHQ